jgi:hypothetical protein
MKKHIERLVLHLPHDAAPSAILHARAAADAVGRTVSVNGPRSVVQVALQPGQPLTPALTDAIHKQLRRSTP